MERRPDVLVVGAGPVGMCAALALAQRGLQPLLVDEGWRPASHTYAVGLHATSLDLLAQLGIQQSLLARGQRVDGLFLYEGGQQHGWMSLADLPAEHRYVLALSQATLEEEFAAALGSAGVRVHWNHRVNALAGGRTPIVRLERLDKESAGYGYATSVWVVGHRWTVQPRFVIGADGASSLVRRAAGIELETIGPAQRYLAAEVALPNGDAGRDLRLLLDGEHADAVWPLKGGACRCSLELPAAEAPRFKERALWAPHPGGQAAIAELVASRVPWIGGNCTIGWSGVAAFERRLATSYGADSVWLAGDAAHTTSPLGVQSLNVGLREAVALADAIAREVRGEAGALRAYEAGFRAEWELLLGRRPLPTNDPWLQKHAAQLVPALPASGPALRHLLRRLGADVEETPAATATATATA